MRQLTVVVGGQYGSEGKGAVVGHIAKHLTERDLVIRVGGPNAGHSVVDRTGKTHRLRQIPAAAPMNDKVQLHIAAGSEIDPDVLYEELLANFEVTSRLTIDPSATLLTADHRMEEAAYRLTNRIGSTGKGIGAARSARVMREAQLWGDFAGAASVWGEITGTRDPFNFGHIVIEGTQGYGLGLHTPHYPFTTSGDCTAVDFLAQAQISPWSQPLDRMTVWVAVRPYPIRVAGNSGPLHGETTWGKLGLPEEFTTVTQKLRRVGTFDPALVAQAVKANGSHPVVKIALMMADQMFPACAGVTDQEAMELADGNFGLVRFIEQIEQECNAQVGLVGTGPDTCVWIRED